MFVVGAILIVLAIIVVIYVTFATRNLDPLSIDWGPFTAALTPLQLFFLGAVAILVLSIGAVMFSIGLKSQGAKRAEVKRLRKEVEQVHSEQPKKHGSAVSDGSRSRSATDDPPSKTSTKDTAERSPSRDTVSGDTRDDTDSPSSSTPPKHTAKLPPPVPPRDSTPPPRSGG
ncbi:MAG: hypothetical protein WA962_04220 [Ornithinimicrobium sp.]